jgi:hypothetical protein
MPTQATDAELPGVVKRLVEAPGARFQRGGRGDRLERRSRGAHALNGAVQQGKIGGWIVEARVCLLGDRLGEDVRVKRGQRPHRIDLAILRIHGHERTTVARRI